MTSTLPSLMPASMASRSAASRRGGFILTFVSYGIGDARIARFAVADRVERLPRAHVRDVDAAARQLGERDVAQRHDRFGLARNAAQAERRGVHPLVGDAVA